MIKNSNYEMPVDDGFQKEIEVGGTEVKVKTAPPADVRPTYYCKACDKSFPSLLDIEEHNKIDHAKASVAS